MGEHAGQVTRRRTGRIVLVLIVVLAVAAGLAGYAWVVRRDVRPSGSGPGSAAVCTDQAIKLSIGADPSASSWIAPLLDEYNAARRAVNGRCVSVSLEDLPSDQVRAALQPTAGEAPPDVWLPESTTSVDLVKVQLRPETARLLDVPEPSVASSPIVLALPAEALQALQAFALKAPVTPGASPFGSMLGLAKSPAGWAAIGRPDWGPIRFATVDPSTTTLGANLVVAAVGANTATAPIDVRATAFNKVDARTGLFAFVRRLVSAPPTAQALFAQASRITTTEELLKQLGILAVYEKDVWRYNDDSPAVLLRAVYPFGGQLAADYPFVVPNAPWVDAADRAGAADLLGWLRSEAVQSRLSAIGLRRASGLVGPELAAAEHGLSDLPVMPVGPRSADGAAAAQANWRLINRPMSILTLMDVSGSMGDPVPGTGRTKLDYAVAAMRNSLAFLDPKDGIGLWQFSRELAAGRDYEQLVPLGTAEDRIGPFPDRRAALAAAYQRMRPLTGTGLYDSVLAGYKDAAARYRPGYVNMLVVVTDGLNEDPGSITIDRLLADLGRTYDKSKPVQVITVAYGADADRPVLERMAKATHGLAFAAVDPRSISDVFIAAISSLPG
jgi:Ca-activated chloride channel family protein